jgi:uncharacterized protein (TIGR03083 family)
MAANWELVTSERRALVELFEGVAGDQWEAPSLCPDWTVKHVLAHLASVLDASIAVTLKAAATGLGRPGAVIDRLTRAYVDRSPADLQATYRSHVDSRFAPPVLGWKASHTDVMVHRMDVAVPLGIDPHRPPEAWRPTLDFLTSGIPMMGSIRGGRPKVTWRTTDLDWSRGSGPEVAGSAAAVGTAISGRAATLEALDGPGVDAVRRWVQS